MLQYVIRTEELQPLLAVLHSVLKISISFYDINFAELPFLDSRKHADYCAALRQDRQFFAACKKCDHQHFLKAQETSQIQIYSCHAGLLEGIVPIYDDQSNFLGAIIFGQVRDRNCPNPHSNDPQLAKLYDKLPEAIRSEMHEIGQLLKIITSVIVRERLVTFRNLGWSEKLRLYIDAHINQRITIAHLAQLINRSPSFLSRHFKKEFGQSLPEYMTSKRMQIALDLLRSGEQVKQVAHKLGYYDAFHFSKVFKKHYGTCPTRHRADVKESETRL
ncbi:MAG: PocR ligand-binding domain-containing protein [Sedimentisphaerales bacterium]|nr:PocR ligand-binding domain-containing protein [Sedimentisphaerales bacterium]